MDLIDSHAHIYLDRFEKDQEDVIHRAKETGVTSIYMPNIDHTSIDDMLEMEEAYQGYCIPMMGLHPCSVKKDFEKELYLVEEWMSKREFCAVGEIGTDLYWDKTYFDYQKEAFNIQCDLAVKYDIPVVIHCRESIDETIALVQEKNNEKLRGVFHCFTGTPEQAKSVIDLGFNIGIGGVATFKNGGLEGVLSEVELESIMLETDSPYLAPVPYRGKRNEPAYIKYVAEKISEIKEVPLGEVAAKTSSCTLGLFEKTV